MSGWDRRGRRAEFSKSDKRMIVRRDGFRCYRCGGPATQADHVIPVAEGGSNDPSNGRAICPECHNQKSRQESQRGYQRHRAKARLPEDPHPFYARRQDARSDPEEERRGPGA